MGHEPVRLYVTLLLGALIALAAVLLGYWWAPFAIGLLVGAIVRRGRIAIPAGALLGLVSWLVPLAAAHSRYGLGRTAAALAAIMGLDHQQLVPVVLTLVVGALLGLTGAWLGASARLLVTSARTGT
jgi:hypothetical protein